MNPNDVARNQILQYFYDRNISATSERGKKGLAMKISDVKRELKTRYGLTQQSVMSNLSYLIDRGWVRKEEMHKTITVNGGTVPSIVNWYKISALGTDKIEGGSDFKPKERFEGVNITATGTNVLTLGDGNVVNARFSPLREHLVAFKTQITASPTLNEEEKLNVVADIESINDQLAKLNPDKTILGHLWRSVERVAALAGLAEAAQKVWTLISPLF